MLSLLTWLAFLYKSFIFLLIKRWLLESKTIWALNMLYLSFIFLLQWTFYLAGKIKEFIVYLPCFYKQLLFLWGDARTLWFYVMIFIFPFISQLMLIRRFAFEVFLMIFMYVFKCKSILIMICLHCAESFETLLRLFLMVMQAW